MIFGAKPTEKSLEETYRVTLYDKEDKEEYSIIIIIQPGKLQATLARLALSEGKQDILKVERATYP